MAGGGMMAGGAGGPGGGMRMGGGMASMTPEQRKAMFEQIMGRLPENVRKEVQKELKGKKPENLTPEDMRTLFSKIRELTGGQGGPRGGRGTRGAESSGVQSGPINLANFMRTLPKATGITPEEEADMAKAKLPMPPEEDSQIDVLLRPGLLSDVEIIVDRIPNAINIPAQAVFDRAGKMFVYVQNKKGEWEERQIQPAKRSESVMVIASGLTPGETIALADPTGQRGADSKKKSEGSGPKSMGGVGGAPRSSR
jgi:hypothetical protein